MIFVLRDRLDAIPTEISSYPLSLGDDGNQLILTYDERQASDVSDVLDQFKSSGIRPKDIYSRQSSLEDIFIQILEA